MIPSIMTITIPIHTTTLIIHGVTTPIPIITTTVAITDMVIMDTIPGTPATDTPQATMMTGT